MDVANHFAWINLLQFFGANAGDNDVYLLLADVFGKPVCLDMLILLHQDLEAVERFESPLQLLVQGKEVDRRISRCAMDNYPSIARQVEGRGQVKSGIPAGPQVDNFDLEAAQ